MSTVQPNSLFKINWHKLTIIGSRCNRLERRNLMLTEEITLVVGTLDW